MRLKDLLDILLVSAVFYTLLAWLRASLPRGVARRSLVGGPIVAAVYVLARSFDLYLLEQVLDGLLVVVLVGAVVVYQTDIRRMLDRAFTRRASDRPKSLMIDTLTEATANMATTKMGALIAIRGREPLVPHVQGGIELGGAVSPPLLYSIFHPGTPGHDGAVLIENDRLTKFAVHLPLASELPDVSRFGGTRHAAALGLSQECDALVIVVSEERGVISIAEGGRLTETVTADQLREHLQRFWQQHHREEPPTPHRWWKSPDLQTALMSIGLATTLWIVLAYSPDTILRGFTVPIELRNLPESWAVADSARTEAQVDLIGSEQSFQELDPEGLTISIDLSRPTTGMREVVIGRDNVALPSGVELRRARPAVLAIELQRTQIVRVSVEIPTVGMLPDSLELVNVRADPDTVSLIIPAGAVSPGQVRTEVLDLRQITGDAEIKNQLVIPPESRLSANDRPEVAVRVDVRERGKE